VESLASVSAGPIPFHLKTKPIEVETQ